MKERPLIFTAESMRGLLDGSKTQTRRPVKDAPADAYEVVSSLLANHGDLWDFRRNLDNPVAIRCPYGLPGDSIWCKEGYALAPACNDPDPEDQDDWSVVYRADADGRPWMSSLDENAVDVKPPWRSPLFMPRWTSRLTLEIVEVRVQRLQEVSEDDAKAEGVEPRVTRNAYPSKHAADVEHRSYRDGYAAVWDRSTGSACRGRAILGSGR